ncbi:MAG TPA: glycoside hydrolase family 2 TIM barrel-domain containing protein, partial [Actinomycetales bacterium]
MTQMPMTQMPMVDPDAVHDVWGDGPMHPRPQLTRPSWEDLCGTWEFAYDDADRGIIEGWQRRDDVFDRVIQVPFPPESPASGINDTGFHPVLWYRRTFTTTPAAGSRLVLHLGAVDYRAQVWVNGRLVVGHEGGNTPFSADITSAFVDGDVQVLVVRAEDRPEDLRQPRGKQDWKLEPHAIWYDRTSGIWQPVWLEEVPETHLEGLRWKPHVDRLAVGFVVRLAGPKRPGMRLRVVLTQHGHVLADDTYAVVNHETERQISLRETDVSLGQSPVLWSPETPNLIEATLTLLDDEGVVDRIGSYTALRSISSGRHRILLNARPYYLRLVLAQNFWPESHLAAPDEAALRREVELAKEMGFNGVRMHQKVEDPRFLAWCDRLGLLVWAEMPAAYEFSTTTTGRLTREWLEVLERDANHPCVIAWVPVNESWGVPALERSRSQQDLVRALYHLTRSIDPTRLVIGNDGWEQPVTDVLTVHDYASSGAVLRQRYGDRQSVERTLAEVQPQYRVVLLAESQRGQEPVLISEFGGISLDVGEDSEGWRGYGGVATSDRLLAGYRELVDALIDSPAIAGFCWTQLTDVQRDAAELADQHRAVVPLGPGQQDDAVRRLRPGEGVLELLPVAVALAQ